MSEIKFILNTTEVFPEMMEVFKRYFSEVEAKYGNTCWGDIESCQFAAIMVDNLPIVSIFFQTRRDFKIRDIEGDLVFVCGAYVEPEYRDRGIYGKFRKLFIDKLRGDKNPFDEFLSGWHVDNTVSQAVQMKEPHIRIVGQDGEYMLASTSLNPSLYEGLDPMDLLKFVDNKVNGQGQYDKVFEN